MTKDEAMRIALEALVNNRYIIESEINLPEALEEFDVAIAALRQALEQTEQEPVAYLYHDTVSAEFANPLADSTLLVLACDRKPNGRNETPLYTAPPKREWVGLTDEERMLIINKLAGQDWVYVVDAIEAKLKEKNHD